MSRSRSNSNDISILHAAMLRGTISIKVTEMDVRRTTDTSLVSALSSKSSTSIETDYILQVSSTSKVKLDQESKSKLSLNSQQVEELETYSCSKRYVDMRNLAHTMREHAEKMVKYYEGRSSKEEGGKKRSSRPSLFKEIEKGLQYLVSDSDSISSNKNESSQELYQGALPIAREFKVGVDKFHDAIYSEKRQFGKKTDYDHVKSVAERRKKIINSAFSELTNAISSAELSSALKLQRDLMPDSLHTLLKSLEKFLLTDVIVDEKKKAPAVAEKSASPTDGDIVSSLILPMTTRRRASVVDRVAEEKSCQEVADLIIEEEKEKAEEKTCRGVADLIIEKEKEKAEEKTCPDVAELINEEEKENEIFIPSAPTEKQTQLPVDTPGGVLPDRPIDFGIIVAVGALLFKALEGRVVNIQMDMLAMFGIACALIGNQLARPSVVLVDSGAKKDVSPAKKPAPTLPKSSTPPKEKGRIVPERGLTRRTLLQKSNGTLKLSESKQRGLSLIQASMRNVTKMEEMGTEKEEKPVVAARTFARFPDGAAIGSHLSCFSSPPSKNFHVRGANYLKDKKKVPSADFLFPCRGCDLFLTDNPPVNVGRNRSILGGKLRDVPTFIINYRLPWGVFLSYHEIPEKFIPFLQRGHGHGDLSAPLPSMANMPAGERALCNFLLSDTEEKNQLLKIVPMVVEGPWMVKRVVGGKPAIIGTKMPITYVYQPPEKGLAEYLEADLDIVSSAAARNILAVVRSYTQTLTIDLGYVVQGNKQENLPEQMMLGLRLHGLDPLTAELLPEFDDGTVVPELDEDTEYDTE